MKTKDTIKKMLEAKISAIAKMKVEVCVLFKKNDNTGLLISIVIDGNEEDTTAAAKRISKMAGANFQVGGYDAELEAYFCGIKE